MNKKKKTQNNLAIVIILEILLIMFWVLSWLNGYIKEGLFLYYNLVLALIIVIALILIVKSSKWLKLLWFLVVLAGLGGSTLMFLSYNLSVNLQY